MNKGKLGLAIAAGAFATYVAAVPYITVYQMKSAAEARDGEALSEHIEFPSVRQSMKDQMNASFANRMSNEKDLKDNPFAALGTAFAGLMVDKMIDAYVTPAGITQLMSGKRPKSNANEGAENTTDSTNKPLANAQMSYESLDKFVIKVKNKAGEEGKFVLRRRGLDWKLTEILLPMN